MKGFITTAVYALIATAVIGFPRESTAQSRSFFPTRPEGVQIYTMEGTLTDYAIGKASGAVVLNVGNVQQEFYTGYPMRINGKVVTCPLPPLGGAAPDRTFCTDWPSDVVLGRSKVKVTFWRMPQAKGEILIADQIDSVR